MVRDVELFQHLSVRAHFLQQDENVHVVRAVSLHPEPQLGIAHEIRVHVQVQREHGTPVLGILRIVGDGRGLAGRAGP